MCMILFVHLQRQSALGKMWRWHDAGMYRCIARIPPSRHRYTGRPGNRDLRKQVLIVRLKTKLSPVIE